MDSVLNLSFSHFKRVNVEKLANNEKVQGNERFLCRPTELTVDSGEVYVDENSFVMKNCKFDTPVLAEFEALNISLIPKNGSVASVMKSSMLDEEDFEEQGQVKRIRQLNIESTQICSSFWCSGCITTDQKCKIF